MEATAAAAISPIVFNRADFNTELTLLGLLIPAKLCNVYLTQFAAVLFDRPRMKRIHNVSDPSQRCLLLHEQYSRIDQLPADLQAYHTEHGHGTQQQVVCIGFDQESVDSLLSKLFAKHSITLQEVPSSYEQAGHIAHVNLRDEALPYKHVIGQVILQKNSKQIRTVVNKVATIATVYRTFPLEIIAGEDDLNVTLRESGARFAFNFAEVYWNSRLQAEHDRLIHLISQRCPNGTVADMMAGVGPFAVPLAMHSVQVYANDLNPASYKYLLANSKSNHCGKYLQASNADGREFIVDLVARGIAFDEVIMNLPHDAPEFLDTFIGLSQRYRSRSMAVKLPMINVYAFSSAEDPVADMTARCAGVLGCEPKDMAVQGHIVRDVAPKKVMVCLSFPLPEVVAESEPMVFPFESRKRPASAMGEAVEECKQEAI